MKKSKLYASPKIELHEIFSNGADVVMASAGSFSVDGYDGSDFV